MFAENDLINSGSGNPMLLNLMWAFSVFVVLLALWVVRLNLRLRTLTHGNEDLQRQLTQVRAQRSFEDQLHEIVGKQVASRFEALSPDDMAALDDVIRARLPQAIASTAANPPPELAAALSARVTARALERLVPALAGLDDALEAALQDRLQAFLSDHDAEFWDTVDRKLVARIVGAVSTPSSELTRTLEQRLQEGLLERAEHLFATPQTNPELFARLDEKLGARIVRYTDEPSPECSRGLIRRFEEGLLERTSQLFARPEDNEYLFETIDEKLGDRIVSLAENLPEEAAVQVDGRISEQLINAIDKMFDEADRHEYLFERVNDKLGERLVRLAGDLPQETAERIDAQICEEFTTQVDHLFDNPGDYERTFERIDEKLSERIIAVATNPPPAARERLDARIVEGVLAIVKELLQARDTRERSDWFVEIETMLQTRIRELERTTDPVRQDV